jgi:Gas vesicle synthesis protein GvpL/GvpF
MTSYVYGIIPAGDAAGWPGAQGVRGGPVRAVGAGDLAALVSDLPADVAPGTREDLESHRRVLGKAIEQGTVIPMRFGMVMDDDDTVRERLLQRHACRLNEVLRELDGMVQMTLRAFYAGDALLRAAIAGDDEIAQMNELVAGHPEAESHPNKVALGERVAAAVDRHRARDAESLLERIRPLVSDIQVDPPGSDRVAASAQLLVRRESRAALDALIAELTPKLEGYIALRYIGPLPPYSFSTLELEPEEAAQAATTGKR